ncbi:MAG: HEPN domain-containing protein [Candidatus Korarchaeota archaeon]|nr:HEPN domain-containing protein [Candidatus Korarchaeota archaeon]
MRREEGEFLRERAEKFFEVGKRLLEEGVIDLAAFHFHQASELILKYALFRITGDYPRTHSIRRLLKLLSKSTGDEGIMEFLRENINSLSNLENAYMTSRYLPAEFYREEVMSMMDVTLSIFELVRRYV